MPESLNNNNLDYCTLDFCAAYIWQTQCAQKSRVWCTWKHHNPLFKPALVQSRRFQSPWFSPNVSVLDDSVPLRFSPRQFSQSYFNPKTIQSETFQSWDYSVQDVSVQDTSMENFSIWDISGPRYFSSKLFSPKLFSPMSNNYKVFEIINNTRISGF